MRLFSITVCALSVMAVSGCDQNWKWPWASADTPGGSGGTISNNSFSGSVKAEFLNPSPPSDYYRDMKLLEDFRYVDPDGVEWKVPAGTITNGASVPWGFWNIVGGPYDGPYRDAAVVHDYYVETKSRTWEATNKMFYSAIRARGVSDTLALTMYAGVRYGGPRWEVAAAPVEPGKQSSLGKVFAVAAAVAGETPPPAEPAPAPATETPAAPEAPVTASPPPADPAPAAAETTAPPPQDPAPAAATADSKPLEPAEKPAPAVRSLGRSMASDQEMKNFDELRLWIEREKPSLDEIDKRVEDMRRREGKSNVRVP